MLDIENYLNDELVKLKCSDFHIKQLIDTIHPLLVIPRNLDTQLFVDWYKQQDIAFKSNPIAWLKKALVNELEKGTFDRKERHCCVNQLILVLRKRKVTVMENADSYLSTMFDYLFNNGYLTEQELITFNNKAVNYLANKGKTTNDFIDLWKKSKVCKERGVDWNAIDTLAKQNLNQWFELIKEIENEN